MTAKQIREIHKEMTREQLKGKLASCIAFELRNGNEVSANAHSHVTARFFYEEEYVQIYSNNNSYSQYISFESIDRIGVDYETKTKQP